MKNITLTYFVLTFTLLTKSVFSQSGLYEVPLEQQINNTKLIIEGKVILKKSFWDSQQEKIYTLNTIEVYKTFKGESNSTIDILTIGGNIGSTGLTVSHSLYLNEGDTGVFLLNNSNKSLLNNTNKKPKYKAYAGIQGFYKYDLVSKKASNIFKIYKSIENDFYKDIETVTKKTHTEVKKKNESSKVTTNRNKLIPFISNFSPTTQTAGTGKEITINGFNFGSIKGIVQFSDGNDGGSTFFNALDSEITSWTNSSITVKVPSRAGTGVIRVSDDGQAFSTSSASLTVPYALINTNGLIQQHYNTNGNGGYTWQMSTDFNNHVAKAPFLRAFNTWVCATGVNWVISPTTTFTSSFARDGINVIAFDTPGDELNPGVLGGTLNWTTACPTGVVIDEIDFIFDNERSNWQYGPAAAASNEIDFESVVLHELGHGHGLAHIISPGSLMHWSVSNGITIRSLSSDDLDAGNFMHNISTNNTKCSKTVMTSISCPSLSINEKSTLNESVNLYPNPTKNEFYIKNLSSINLEKIIVFDISGRVIYEKNLLIKPITSINLVDTARGIYFVNIHSKHSVITKKIILE